LIFKADVNFFFATALEGHGPEERELKKEYLFAAEKNFFFAQGLAEREPPEEEGEPAYTIRPQPTDDESGTMAKEAANEEPEEDEPNVSAAREKIRRMAASALSYEEQSSQSTPGTTGTPRGNSRGPSSASGDGTATVQRHWWEKSVSTAPRQPCVKYPPDFGDVNV
jgi:hypothetical protein